MPIFHVRNIPKITRLAPSTRKEIGLAGRPADQDHAITPQAPNFFYVFGYDRSCPIRPEREI
jgi:hypothetical protein